MYFVCRLYIVRQEILKINYLFEYACLLINWYRAEKQVHIAPDRYAIIVYFMWKINEVLSVITLLNDPFTYLLTEIA